MNFDKNHLEWIREPEQYSIEDGKIEVKIPSLAPRIVQLITAKGRTVK